MTYKEQTRANLDEIIILSGCKSGLSANQNHTRNNELRIALDQLGIGFCGCVRHFGGNKEVSFMVEVESQQDVEKITGLAGKFGQSCVLFSNNKRQSKLLFINGDEKELGTLEQLPNEGLASLDFYIEVPSHIHGGKKSFWGTK